jgi:hypothetical protein
MREIKVGQTWIDKRNQRNRLKVTKIDTGFSRYPYYFLNNLNDSFSSGWYTKTFIIKHFTYMKPLEFKDFNKVF